MDEFGLVHVEFQGWIGLEFIYFPAENLLGDGSESTEPLPQLQVNVDYTGYEYILFISDS